MKPTVAIAGATGFIGRWFIEHYSHKYRIIALSRREMDSSLRESVEWRKVDMFAVVGVDGGTAVNRKLYNSISNG